MGGVSGGLRIAIEYAISSVLMMITIIGIPFGLQTMKLAVLALWPFGTDISNESWPYGCIVPRLIIDHRSESKSSIGA